MMQKQNNQLKIGIVLSYINLALSVIIPFFYSPAVLRMLGDSEYGLHSLSASIIGYLSLLTFGLGSTILRYLTVYRAKGDKENEEALFGFFILVYCFIAVLIFIGGFVAAGNVNELFKKGLTTQELAKMRVLVPVMAFSSAISLPISVFSSVALAHEQYVFRKLMDVCLTILGPLVNLIALWLGYASVGMAVASVIVHFLVLPVNMYYCFRILHVKPLFRKIPSELVKEILGFSSFVFLATIVDTLFWATDKMMLGMLLGSAAVTIYNIGGTFNSMVLSITTSISNILTTRITTMVAQNATDEELTDSFIKVGRIQFIVVALIVSGFTVFGQSFISLWMGEKYLPAYWITVMTLFPLCIPMIQSIGISIMTAKNKHRFRSIVYLIIAIANATCTYFMIPKYGPIGAAFCSCMAYLLGQGLIMNLYYWKKIRIDIPLFWKNIISMSYVAVAMTIVGLIIKNIIIIRSWIVFFSLVAAYTLIYFLLMYKLNMNEFEKSFLISVIKKAKILIK